MFVSFFPKPKPFFISAAVWTVLAILGWYTFGEDLGAYFGLPPLAPGSTPIIGVTALWSPPFLWFYIYYTVVVAIFGAFWMIYAPHPWAMWSIFGTALIVFTTYFQVQVSVQINAWYGPFYDMVQAALSKTRTITIEDFYYGVLTFLYLALFAVTIIVITRFFISHYIFRWRTAMNDFYMSHWGKLRKIEGASQRVQEDTMRFSTTTEGLGVSLIDSVMTLIAFLPVLLALSKDITTLPLIGDLPYALVFAALVWSAFGTAFLAVIGIKLPGLEFRNQRVEAAYRKELVYGEDDADRAQPPTVRELFSNVRRNYFRLYFHYMYFNVARFAYLNIDNIFSLLILGPSIVAGAITFGIMNQIMNSFDQVRSSFQYLITSWTTIVELISIYKRLRSFEAAIYDEPLPEIDQRWMARQESPAE